MTNVSRRMAAVAVAALLVAGCGGGQKENGIDKLSADQALAKVKTAVSTVETVHVHGNINQGTQTLGLDLHLKKGAGQGTLTIGGGRFDLVYVGGTVYGRGNAAALQASGASAAQAQFAAGKWLKSSSTTGGFQSFSSLLDMQQLFSNLLQPSGTISKGKVSTVAGVKTMSYLDSGKSGGTLYISLVGKPLPVREVNTSTNGGTVDFTDYDKPLTVTAPSGAVDLSQLGQ